MAREVWDGEGAFLRRGTRLWIAMALFQSEQKDCWDGSDPIIVFQEAVCFLCTCADGVSKICLRSSVFMLCECVSSSLFSLISRSVYPVLQKEVLYPVVE